MPPRGRPASHDKRKVAEMRAAGMKWADIAKELGITERTAMRAMPKRGGWQPIETAPKDGTKVLVYGNALQLGPGWYIAHFKTDLPDGEPYWHWGAPGYIGRVEPVGWMPLLEPPTE